MPQSLARLHIHLVFSTKNRDRCLTNDVRPALHACLATVLQNLGCPPVLLNSVEDRVHVLFELGRTLSVRAAVEEVKKSSSKWIKTQGPEFAAFACNPDTVRSRSANPMSRRFGITSRARRSTIGENRFRTSIERFWSGIASPLTSVTCGIRSPLQGSSRSAHKTQGVALGWHGAGRWPSRESEARSFLRTRWGQAVGLLGSLKPGAFFGLVGGRPLAFSGV
jgi:REP element-mobilizing transposase RayT